MYGYLRSLRQPHPYSLSLVTLGKERDTAHFLGQLTDLVSRERRGGGEYRFPGGTPGYNTIRLQ